MTGEEFALKCQEVLKYKTCYAKGTFGQCATSAFIRKKATQYPAWYTSMRIRNLEALPDDTRLFDCVGLIKAVFWNFPNTVYASNGLKDQNDQKMWESCKDRSEDFSNIQIGELVWMQGHVGLYIGNGKAIECTGAWENKVLISAVSNIGFIQGLHHRRWTGHGKLPFLTYDKAEDSNSNEKPKVDYSNYPVLKKGSTGEYVKILQQLLVSKGYNPKGIDGIFGPGCKAAVIKFQKENTDIDGKKLVVDGCVGPKTWGSLYK